MIKISTIEATILKISEILAKKKAPKQFQNLLVQFLNVLMNDLRMLLQPFYTLAHKNKSNMELIKQYDDMTVKFK